MGEERQKVAGTVSSTFFIKPEIRKRTQVYHSGVFYWCTAVPCYAMLVVFWKLSLLIRKNNLFSWRGVNDFQRCSVALTLGLAAFLSATSFFSLWVCCACVGGGEKKQIYSFFCGCVVIVRYYRIAKKAEKLQKESDGTI